LGVILSAVYMLWMFQRVYYGEVTDDHNRHMPDLSLREWAIVGPLVAAAIFMGVFPNVFLKPMEPGVARIVQRVEQHQPFRVSAPLALPAPLAPSALAPSAPPAPSAPSAPLAQTR
jgi:NADH-quinone oxidoreductase subunit M